METKRAVRAAGEMHQEFVELIGRIWLELRRSRPTADLCRVRQYLDVMIGQLEPPPDTEDRAVFRRMYFPGITARPFYEPHEIGLFISGLTVAALDADCQRAFAIRDAVLDHSDLAADGGTWQCVYLKQDFRWLLEAGELCVGTSRFLGSQRVATEALFSRLLPGTAIQRHSDLANYVITVHIPMRTDCSRLAVAGVHRPYERGGPAHL